MPFTDLDDRASAQMSPEASASASPVAGAQAQPALPHPAHPAQRSRPRRLIPLALLVASLVGSLLALAQVATAQWSQRRSSPAAAVSPTSATIRPTVPTVPIVAPTDHPGETQIAGLDALSPELASYVAGQGSTMGVAIYDLTRNRSYVSNQTTTFTLASSAKVYILCAYLDSLERQHRAPSGYERSEMTLMIEESDNNAAQWLYNRIGQAAGQARYLTSIGIMDYIGRGYDWGWAQLSPADMVRILTLLQTDQILSAADRAFALSLLGHVELGRWGVGDTAPSGARVYMKDGWVTGPDGRWAQNSSGIVVVGGETYIISVYTAHLPRYDWGSIQRVCAEAGELLTANAKRDSAPAAR
jgi:beta-lactamase class A